jgi:hypothetical protein
MPKNTQTSTTNQQFVEQLNENYAFEGDGIQIAADFQRGDEETGVWGLGLKREYIDSLLNGYPVGPTMLIKPAGSCTHNKWMILDGGNRARALRDFFNNKFKTKGENSAEKKFFKDLDIETREKLKHAPLYLIQVRITRADPDDIVAELFTRINTKIAPLKDGELIKALGWQDDRIIIQTSKMLIGQPWFNAENFDDENTKIKNCRERFQKIFPAGKNNTRETKRCDNLAMMCGYIVSSITNNLNKFDKRFPRLKTYLKKEYTFEKEDQNKFYTRMNTLCDILENIKDTCLQKLIPSQCGMPSRIKIFPIWGLIVTEAMTEELKSKIISFYHRLENDSELRLKYDAILSMNGNSEIGSSKLDSIKNIIKATIQETIV